MKTYVAKPKEIETKWHLIDARDKVLGRLASRIAVMLRGKDKAEFTPHVNTGDGVVVINAEKIKVTGRKMDQKIYKSFSGYPGGLKETLMKDVLKRKPEYIITHAVKGMLPKNKLADQLLKKLKVYAGPEHPHKSQNPELLEV
ncbi:MAG: 50S ribosomal protein L13 [Candidatus Omnitrophica bacterium]|nr:50S ribosomal protein L13 [Candidatus Omnitrophota bacterium]